MNQIEKSPPWKLAVYAAIRNPSGHLLLLRRHPSKANFPGYWELPGGKPVRKESFDDTALVEVFEETGLDVRLTGVAGAVEGSVPGVRVALLIMEGDSNTSQITLSDEHDDFRWLPLDEAASLKLRPGFDLFLAEYAARNSSTPSKTKTADNHLI